MKKTLSTILALVLALALTLGCVSFAAAEEAAPAGPVAYLMYADAAWAYQYWSGEAPEGVTPINADVTGPGEYTVGLEFAEEAQGLAFTAIGITDGELKLPGYTIELKAVRVNGEEIAFQKGYTSSDDGIVTRMNLYNEWVTEVPADARSFDASLDGAAPVIVDKEAFAAVKKVEVDFVLHRATAYIMYANADWSVSYWGGAAPEGVTATNAEITEPGDYSVALEFATPSKGLAFTALGLTNGELSLPGAFLKINEIRINGEAVAFEKGYTSSDDKITTRMNIYNEWVGELPEDAHSFDGSIEDAKPVIVDKELFADVSKFEIDFTLVPVTDTAYLMYADSAWGYQYWGGEAPEGVTATNAEITGPGTYTVGLEFAEEAPGLAFTAVGIVTGEQTFNGYFINVTEMKVNGEAIELGKGYTSSDDGICTRENLYNEWVGEIPSDARRADGDLEGASAIIVDKEAFAAVKTVEVTFDFIYGKPVVKNTDAPLTAEEAAELQKVDYNAYIGVQSSSYIFRNTWDEANYGRDSEHADYFTHLVGWDADNNAVDYGGSFEDVLLTKDGTYSVSLTTGEMGFGSDEAFRMLFVSTEIPSKLVADGYVKIEDVKVKIGDAATQSYTDVDTTGTYARIIIIDEYNRGDAPFGYTVPGANATITITFTVTGLTD
jgi:hypothetical protein